MLRRIPEACLLLIAAFSTSYATPEKHEWDDTLHHFKTRPDIKAPKYEVEFYNKSAVSPGYVLVGPYETLDLAEELHDSWIGPAIYDTNGELVWSGAPLFEDSNTEDFRISNVAGEQMFTVMDQQHAQAVVMDLQYNIKERLKMQGSGIYNSHELHFVQNGTRALVVFTDDGEASEEESALVGFDGRCRRSCNGIAEYETTTWEQTWEWNSCGHILLNECTMDKWNTTWHCQHNWDYVHANSIDVTPEGDHLFSARHEDAIFKISRETGDIIWRLGGRQSDFMMNGINFTRQHDIRFRGYNGTHTMVSILDNALGEDAQGPSYNFSRGLLLALDEKSEEMSAHIVTQYDHPEGEGRYSNRRGNMQILPNGNVLMGWSQRGQFSEYLADGTMIMRACFQPRWLGTYRTYKFDYVGLPEGLPDVVAETLDADTDSGTQTAIYASWNGATEIASWHFYRTNPLGHYETLLGSVKRESFEAGVVYDGYAKHIVVAAVHSNGTVLARSKVYHTYLTDDSTIAVEQEERWQYDHTPLWYIALHNTLFVASALAVVGISALLAVYKLGRHIYAAWPKTWTRRRVVESLDRGLLRRKYAALHVQVPDMAEGHMDPGSAIPDSSVPLMEGEKSAWRRFRRRESDAFSIDGDI